MVLFNTQFVTYSANGLQPYGVCRVLFDLATKPIDLHVDRSLANLAILTGEFVAWNCFSSAFGKYHHYVLFALGKLDGFCAFFKLPTRNEKSIRPEHNLFDFERGWRRSTT